MEDLIAQGRYVGDYSASNSYAIGDVTLYEGKIYFCFSATAVATDNPSEDTAHFDFLPLINSEVTIVNDTFDYSPGPLQGRQTTEGLIWETTGGGYQDAYVDPAGFLSSSGNTYYILRNLPGPISEFGTVQSSTSASAGATMAISPNNLQNGFSEMWHVNWTDTLVGSANYWHDGAIGVPASYKFSYNAGLTYTRGSLHELIMKIRGKFIFGYLDGALAFIHLSDLIETLTATSNAVYTQNHRPSFGTEKVHQVWIKGSVDTDGDGLRDSLEANVIGTDPFSVDSDGDGLVDGNGGVVPLAALPGGIDMNSDGFVDGEQDFGTSPINTDSDTDGLLDGDEVYLYGTNPTISNKGDVAPRGNPDDLFNVGDLIVMMRLGMGVTPPTGLESILGDINTDGQINAADILLLRKAILNGAVP